MGAIWIDKRRLGDSQARACKSEQLMELRGPSGVITINLGIRSLGKKKNGKQRLGRTYTLREYQNRNDSKSDQRMLWKDIGKETSELLIGIHKKQPGVAFGWAQKIVRRGAEAAEEMKKWLSEMNEAKLKFSKHKQPEECDDTERPYFVRVVQTS